MSASSNSSPHKSTQPGAFATGCLVAAVALAAAVAGMYLGARHGLPWASPASPAQDAATPAAVAEKKLWTCSMHPQVIQDHPGLCPICHMELVSLGSSGKAVAHAEGLQIDPAVVQNMGVRTARVRRGALAPTIRATGYLREAEPNVHEVNLRVSGWIDKLYADYDGKFVRAGEPLFEVYSPEIQQAAGELINASKTGGANFAPLGNAARRKLELWGIGKSQIDGIAAMAAPPRAVTFYSPATGHVLEKQVIEGTGIAAGQKLLNIVDHSLLWMDITLFERDLPFVALGDPVSVTTEAHSGAPLEGVVDFIHPHVDMATRAATARLSLHNPDLSFRPGMYATAILKQSPGEDVLLIPREAIIDTGTRQLVFLARGGGHFEARPVRLGAADTGGEVEVAEGLSENDEVVVSGQFLLDNEARLKEAVRKFLGTGAPEPPAAAIAPVTPATEAPEMPVAKKAASSSKTDLVLDRYVQAAEALGKDEQESPEFDAGPLQAALAVLLKEKLPDSTGEAAKKLGAAMEDFAKSPPKQRREAFKAVSAAAISLAKATPLSTAPLYEVYCSMVDASWLQRSTAVSNPFYADMKTCGEVKGRIPGGEPAQ